jgi:hypothetical protein
VEQGLRPRGGIRDVWLHVLLGVVLVGVGPHLIVRIRIVLD